MPSKPQDASGVPEEPRTDATRRAETDAADSQPPPVDAEPGEQPAERFDPGNRPKEYGGRSGPDPVRYGDWEKNGRCIDF